MFRDRQDAGKKLAETLGFLKGHPNVVVLGIPRGGVVVAHEIARALKVPLEVWITRKIGAPGNPEFAIGAISSQGEPFLDQETIRHHHIPQKYLDEEIRRQQDEMNRQLKQYCGSSPALVLRGKTVVLADDGVATGASMMAALKALRQQHPAKIILALPVGPPETIRRLQAEADQVIVLETPDPFWAVGQFYVDFRQTTDEEVLSALQEALRP